LIVEGGVLNIQKVNHLIRYFTSQLSGAASHLLTLRDANVINPLVLRLATRSPTLPNFGTATIELFLKYYQISLDHIQTSSNGKINTEIKSNPSLFTLLLSNSSPELEPKILYVIASKNPKLFEELSTSNSQYSKHFNEEVAKEVNFIHNAKNQPIEAIIPRERSFGFFVNRIGQILALPKVQKKTVIYCASLDCLRLISPSFTDTSRPSV